MIPKVRVVKIVENGHKLYSGAIFRFFTPTFGRNLNSFGGVLKIIRILASASRVKVTSFTNLEVCILTRMGTNDFSEARSDHVVRCLAKPNVLFSAENECRGENAGGGKKLRKAHARPARAAAAAIAGPLFERPSKPQTSISVLHAKLRRRCCTRDRIPARGGRKEAAETGHAPCPWCRHS